MKKNHKRFLCLILSFIMIISVSGNLFANTENYSGNNVGSESINISKEMLKEKFPLSAAYLNSERERREDAEKIYVLQFEDGKKDEIIAKLKNIKGLEIKYQYDAVFEGVSVKINANKIGEIRDMEGIKNIQENGTFAPQMLSAKQITGVKKLIDYNEDIIKNLPPEEKAKKKLDGRGLVVAVIDSGLDVGHEAMKIDEEAKPFMKIKSKDIKEGFTEKVPHGFSYVGGGNDFMDKVTAGHGMHCAGVIAGNSETLKGVVPNAQLFVYRIFSDQYYGEGEENSSLYEFGGDDSVYHAIDDAVKNGADVISMSIGQAGNGYVGDLYYETVNRAADKGVIVVSAIGNYSSSSSDNTYDINPLNNIGLTDTSAMTYYSGIGRILAVGSVTNTSRESRVLEVGDKKFPYTTLGSLKYNLKAMETNFGDFEFVFVGHGRESAYKNIDVADKVVISLRDGARTKGSRIVDKIKIAKSHGAKGIIVMNAPISFSRDTYMDYPITSYENDSEMDEVIKDGKIWAISLSGKDGKDLQNFAKTGKFKVSFPSIKEISPLSPEIRLSGFSGWGPNAELELKPEIVAPGENIYSTMNRSRYGFMSGTSMATPHVSGICALLVQRVNEIVKNPFFEKIGKSDTNKILLMNTAEPLKDVINKNLEVSPRRQGAGLVKADRALINDVFITHNNKASVELKDFKESKKTFKLRFDNIGTKDRTYNIRFSEVLGEGVVVQEKLSLSPEKIKTGEFTDTFEKEEVKSSVPVIINNAGISTNKKSITIPAGSFVELKFTLETGDVDSHFVEGYIYFDSEKEDEYPNLSIPYFGFKGDWQKGSIIDKPMWEKDSVYKHTTIVGLYPGDGHDEDIAYKILGVPNDAFPIKEYKYGRPILDEERLKENYMVDPDKISFSVGFMAANPKEVTLRMVALREVKDLEVGILDKNKKLVRVVSKSQNYRKQIKNVINESAWQAKVYHRPNILFKWDGKLYNPKNGEMELAPSGQYYYRVRAKVKTTDEYEETIMPVKLDNTSPKTTDLSYDFSKDGKSRDITFKIRDDVGVMFVGASLDNKPIEVKKLSEDEYKIENLKINELTKSRLHIEAMDFATNLMEPVEVDLNDDFMDLTNYQDVVKGNSDNLKAKIQNAKVHNLEAYQGKVLLKLEKDNEDIEISLVNKNENVQIIAKDIDGNVIGERFVKLIIGNNTDNQQSHSYGPKDFEKMSDDESSKFRRALNYGMLNYYILTSKSSNLDYFDDIWHFNPSGGWYIFFWDKYADYGFDLSNYTLKATAYNILAKGHENYEPTWKLEVSADDVPDKPDIPVYDGTNIINLTFVEKATGKIIFSRGVLVMIDTHNPLLTLDQGNIDSSSKIVYANSDSVTLSGKISDNLDEVYLDLNGNNIVTKRKQGDFGKNTETEFSSTINVQEGDFVTLQTKDRFGNIEKIQYKVVMDKEAPTIEIKDKDKLNGESVLEILMNDNVGLREGGKQIFVNGKPYEDGKKLSEYNDEEKFFIEAKAIDKAGNITEENHEIGLTDSDKELSGVTLSKNKFTKEQISKIKDYVNLPEGYSIVNVGDVDLNNDKVQNIVIEVKNKLGVRAKFTFEITIVEEEVVDLDNIKLLKEHFLPEELIKENLFDLPDDIVVEIPKIDASKLGKTEITVTFNDGNRILKKNFIIYILPELKLELKKTLFRQSEIKDINNIIKPNENFTYKFIKVPSDVLGIQEITVLIEDKYNHKKEQSFRIEVIADSSASSPNNESGNSGSRSATDTVSVNKDTSPVPKDKLKDKKNNLNEEKYKIVDFTDINEHWAKEVIMSAVKENLIKGYPDNTFKPNNPTSRSEFVTMINRFFKFETVKSVKFEDVELNDWYVKDLNALFEKGLVKGNGKSQFLPKNHITREEIASILIRYIEKEVPELLKIDLKELQFVDKEDISNWAKDNVIKAYSLGILSGDDKSMIMAKKNATRAEVLQMIYNFKKVLQH